jgi:hypothetical protein
MLMSRLILLGSPSFLVTPLASSTMPTAEPASCKAETWAHPVTVSDKQMANSVLHVIRITKGLSVVMK